MPQDTGKAALRQAALSVALNPKLTIYETRLNMITSLWPVAFAIVVSVQY
jgi:hypothetical protein